MHIRLLFHSPFPRLHMGKESHGTLQTIPFRSEEFIPPRNHTFLPILPRHMIKVPVPLRHVSTNGESTHSVPIHGHISPRISSFFDQRKSSNPVPSFPQGMGAATNPSLKILIFFIPSRHFSKRREKHPSSPKVFLVFPIAIPFALDVRDFCPLYVTRRPSHPRATSHEQDGIFLSNLARHETVQYRTVLRTV